MMSAMAGGNGAAAAAMMGGSGSGQPDMGKTLSALGMDENEAKMMMVKRVLLPTCKQNAGAASKGLLAQGGRAAHRGGLVPGIWPARANDGAAANPVHSPPGLPGRKAVALPLQPLSYVATYCPSSRARGRVLCCMRCLVRPFSASATLPQPTAGAIHANPCLPTRWAALQGGRDVRQWEDVGGSHAHHRR